MCLAVLCDGWEDGQETNQVVLLVVRLALVAQPRPFLFTLVGGATGDVAHSVGRCGCGGAGGAAVQGSSSGVAGARSSASQTF